MSVIVTNILWCNSIIENIVSSPVVHNCLMLASICVIVMLNQTQLVKNLGIRIVCARTGTTYLIHLHINIVDCWVSIDFSIYADEMKVLSVNP